MFDEEEDLSYEQQLNADVERFEAHLYGNQLGFIDSDRMEGIIDHYFSKGEFSKAKRASELAYTNFPFQHLFKLRIIQSLCGEKKFKDALTQMQLLNKDQLPSFEVNVTYASIYHQMGNTKKAIAFWFKAMEDADDEEKVEIYHDISLAYQQINDFDACVALLEKALDQFPEVESLLYELGFMYDRLDRHTDAVRCYLSYIDENPYASMAWYNLGNSYSKNEDYDKAIWAYDYCLLIFEEFSPAHFNLGNAYLTSGKVHQAIDCFNRVLELEGDDPMALCYLGEAHEQLKEFEIAINYYRLCLEIQPDIHEAWLGLGIIKDLQGDTREAITLLRKAQAISPDNASVNLVLANAYHKLEQREEAENYYLRSLSLDFDDPEALQDYTFFLLEDSPLIALNYLQENQQDVEFNDYYFALLTHVLVHLGRNEDALLLFAGLVESDKQIAQLLLEWNPKLKFHKDFINLLND